MCSVEMEIVEDDDELGCSCIHTHTHTYTQHVPVGVRETCAELFGACICMRPDSCDCADLCFGHLL